MRLFPSYVIVFFLILQDLRRTVVLKLISHLRTYNENSLVIDWIRAIAISADASVHPSTKPVNAKSWFCDVQYHSKNILNL